MNNTLQQLSVVIICKDAAETLPDTLASVADFAEVIVYDNGSTDESMQIAQSFANVKLVQGEFNGFGLTKQAAIACAANDWVFSLDADEVVSADLLAFLATLPLQDPHQLWEILRHNHFLAARMRHGGLSDDWVLRIFNRQHYNIDDSPVHEAVRPGPDAKVLRAEGHLRHNTWRSLHEVIDKVQRYSELRSGDSDKTSGPLLIYLRAHWAFFRAYILQLGLLDGWRGLVHAKARGDDTFYKYMKRYVRVKHVQGSETKPTSQTRTSSKQTDKQTDE